MLKQTSIFDLMPEEEAEKWSEYIKQCEQENGGEG